MNSLPKWIAATAERDGRISYLRRSFSLRDEVSEATLRLSLLGHGRCYLNGEPVCPIPFGAPAPRGACFAVREIPVTEQLATGENVLSITLENGGCARLSLTIRYADGDEEEIHSDSAFCCTEAEHHTLSNGMETLPLGENTAYRRAGYDDAAWGSVCILPGNGGTPLKDEVVTLRRVGRVRPVAITEAGVYDFGETITGALCFLAEGEKGDVFTVRYGRCVDGDGRLIPDEQTGETYIKSVSKETPTPTPLGYRAFRYAEIRAVRRGGEITPPVKEVGAAHIRLHPRPIGAFRCESEALSRIFTDTAKRILRFDADPAPRSVRELTELFAYGEDRLLLFDGADLLSCYLWRYADEQLPDGQIPILDDDGRIDLPATADPMYGAALILLPYEHFLLTGGRTLAALLWDTMVRYMDFLATVAEDGILVSRIGEYGERKDAVRAPRELLGTALYYRFATAMATLATALGEDSTPYTTLAAGVRRELRERYFESGNLLVGGQTAIATVLFLRVANAAEVAALHEELALAIEKKDGRADVSPMISRFLLACLEAPALRDVGLCLLEKEGQAAAAGLPGSVGFCLRVLGGIAPPTSFPTVRIDPKKGGETSALLGGVAVTGTGGRIHIRAERDFLLSDATGERKMPEGEYSFSAHT